MAVMMARMYCSEELCENEASKQGRKKERKWKTGTCILILKELSAKDRNAKKFGVTKERGVRRRTDVVLACI